MSAVLSEKALVPLLVRDDRGIVTVPIEDADGVVRHYRLEKAAAGLDDEAWWLTRIDTGAAYRVSRDGKAWFCPCEAFRWRRGQRGLRFCKHVRGLMPLVAWMEQFR